MEDRYPMTEGSSVKCQENLLEKVPFILLKLERNGGLFLCFWDGNDG